MNKKFYITTAIPYANSPLHVGHVLEYVEADVIARYHKFLGEDVYHLAGADENAQKNVLAAEKAGVPIQEFIDQNVDLQKKALKLLNISNDQYIKTSDKKIHFPGVQKLWQECEKSGDIYKKKYVGYYCVGCESFVTDKDLKDGVCPEHLTEPEKIEEENYFFKLSNYQKKIIELIEKDNLKIIPDSRKNETLSFLKSGLDDLSISRPIERTKGWGVPVPGDNNQTIYVWMDALINYITALGYGRNDKLFKEYWPADIHVIGKGISRFHTIFFPAFLLSAGIKLPKSIFIHEYLTVNGQKISKTLGNVIDPIELVEKYGTDPIRYFLLREFSPFSDGDFTIERLEQRYNSDLANGLGNLVNRVLTMVEKYCDGKVPEIDQDPEKHPLVKFELKTWKDIDKCFETLKFHEGLSSIWQFISEADKYIEDNKPWELAKQGKTKELDWVLYGLLDALHQIAWQLYVFIPETSLKIAQALQIQGLLKEDPNKEDGWINIKSGTKIQKIESLFPRIE